MSDKRKEKDMEKTQKSWGKRILKIVGVLLVLIIGAVIGIYYYLGAIVKEAIGRFVPPVTGTTASVESVDLSLIGGHIDIQGLKIGNPAGYSDKNIFELGSIRVDFEPKTILSDKIIIRSVVVSGTKVSAELKNLYSLDSNVKTLQQNIEHYLGTNKKADGSKAPTAESAKTESKAASKQVIVRDLSVRGSELSVGVAGKTVTLPLPDIHQTNIGEGKEKKSLVQVMADLLDSLSLESIKALAVAVKDLAKQGLIGAKGILESGVDQLKGAGEAVGKGAKGALDSLKSLF